MNRKFRAVVVGLDYHARFLAGLMNKESRIWLFRAYDNSRLATLQALLALRKADVLICFGGPSPNVALTIAASRRNIPVIVIWAGSDVMKAQTDPFELETIKQEGFINIAVAPWLVDELKLLGIQSEYVPVAGMEPGAPVKPLPKNFRVLTYLPEPRRDFYGAPLVYAAAQAMPDVRFTVVGAGPANPDVPSNVEFCGLVHDMSSRIDASTVLLRQPEHDGTSMLVLEALSRARHVVWNYEFPHVKTARALNEVLVSLRELARAHAAGTLQLNGDDFKIYHNRIDVDDCAGFCKRSFDGNMRNHLQVAPEFYHGALETLLHALGTAFEAINARIASPRVRSQNKEVWEALFATFRGQAFADE